MTVHDIRVQAWGHDPVLVCRTCTREIEGNRVPTVLLRTTEHAGLSYDEVAEAGAAHQRMIDLSAARAAYETARVPGSLDLGPEEEPPPLVAFGDDPEFGPGYHPRTGQKLEEPNPGHLRTDGGPSLREYLESKGEI